ncbi:transcription-repair coupling factor [Marinihelvus fidelis]|uniref:Transcription-repair-coupling factor n=1 Tax=Marinihelvus fidelis TaxID=2613842 RepID=A0A5N0TIS2_9GAMM|nr:transcription-repair coupling factor [Marinihelvus fidelis]KAA9133189.1 transcription-repair coupling factor [Marinihelvus fidelis]
MTTPLQDARFDAGAGASTTWAGPHGSALALALLRAAAGHDGPVLVVTRSSHRAQYLHRDLRLLGDGSVTVRHFPDRETLPFDPFSAHPEIVSERLATLTEIAAAKQGLLLVPAATLLERLPPRTHVLGNSLDLRRGQKLAIEAFREQMLNAGYSAADQVYQTGQFAVRGSVLDLFPTGLDAPIRIDLFDDEIDSIRTFDPESQRSSGEMDALRMLPAREYPADADALESFRRAFRNRFAVDMTGVPLYRDLKSGVHPQGLEQYLPLFFDGTETLFDYLPSAPLVVEDAGARDAMLAFASQTRERHEQRRHDVERPVLRPEELFLEPTDVMARLDERPRVRLAAEDTEGPAVRFATTAAPALPIHERGKDASAELSGFIERFPGRVMFAADTAGRREAMAETLATFSVRPTRFDDWPAFSAADDRLGIAVLPLEEGFIAGDDLAVLTETQLFTGRARRTGDERRSDRDPEAIIRDLNDLEEGAPVVHEEHGVGRYLGLQTLAIDDRPAEFLAIGYANDDKLYVPVTSLHLVSRYTGASQDSAPMHKLGGEQWSRARRKAAEKVRDVAAELLDLYARRQAREGFAFPLDERMYQEFAATFPYEETPDQLRAIDAIRDDMRSPRPMDRVVCGDVGFGKTEVALRAAFIAVQGGKQVAVLAPTTLLAQQHYATFADRLADWPVKIEALSRFRTAKQSDAVLERLSQGKVDIVVGTHRLIQRDVKFDNLGLVIVDEEQRFGVRQKERLKEMRAEVDLLTLTATPIPRTLNMALAGIRDLSIIATPPARRIAVKTMIVEWDKALLREALQREIQRGGQVFFLHNEVRNIERIAREVGELVPEARVRVAHGQMRELELEQVMLDFHRQRFHVLVCTTIIENGIDIPSANTIIINRADRFGLSQLHQLRGRVGRSHHLAYAYLVTPDPRALTADARKRLDAIASLEELGAGFTLATHDMEIRGAGELLGEDQSGQIQQVGFSLYSELLERAVDALREGREPDLESARSDGADVELHVAALIPEDYLGDVHARLTLYKRIASAADDAELRELQVEMIDRFGLLPQPVKNLFAIATMKLKARSAGVVRLDFGPRGGRIEFAEDAGVDVDALLKLVREQPGQFRLGGPERLLITSEIEDGAKRVERATELLGLLSGKD